MNGRVAVLGGGVAGLTAADELSRRGYRVDVYDAADELGGRARWARCFPGYFRNLFDTMGSIPAASGTGTVADRLVALPALTLVGGNGSASAARSLAWSNLAPTRIGQLSDAVDELLNGGASAPGSKPFGELDVAYLAHLLGVVALADRHKLLELEGHRFTDYTCRVFAERSVLKPSTKLESFLAKVAGLLIAAEPNELSARTGLVTLLRLVNPLELYTERGDRVLPGAVDDEWIHPWVADLAAASAHRIHGVTFHRSRPVTALAVDGNRLRSFTIAGDPPVSAFDHVVCALPHPVVSELAGDVVAGVRALRSSAMAAVSFRLRTPVGIGDGRTVHLDSPWRLSMVERDRVLSVVAASVDGDADDVAPEIWRQLRERAPHLPADRQHVVVDEHVHGPTPVVVNAAGSWAHRPASSIGYRNLYLAGDYVRTDADLATLESANESARRAVQALLDVDGYHGPAVKISTVDHLGLME